MMQPLPAQRRLPAGRKPQGFARSQRLLDGQAFKQVFEHARRVGNPHWTVFGWRHADTQGRLGLAIAKRYVRRAHERNRLKRLARETWRLMQSELGGVDLVVMSGKAAQAADNATLRLQLHKLFLLFSPRNPKPTDRKVS